MKKLILIIFLCIFFVGCSKEGNSDDTKSSNTIYSSEYVYICTGNYATAYHKKSSCTGLNNCKGEIISTKDITGRSACKICYK